MPVINPTPSVGVAPGEGAESTAMASQLGFSADTMDTWIRDSRYAWTAGHLVGGKSAAGNAKTHRYTDRRLAGTGTRTRCNLGQRGAASVSASGCSGTTRRTKKNSRQDATHGSAPLSTSVIGGKSVGGASSMRTAVSALVAERPRMRSLSSITSTEEVGNTVSPSDLAGTACTPGWSTMGSLRGFRSSVITATRPKNGAVAAPIRSNRRGSRAGH